MPALILPFYDNGTVVDYVREKDNDAKLEAVSVFRTSEGSNPSDYTLCRWYKSRKGLNTCIDSLSYMEIYVA